MRLKLFSARLKVHVSDYDVEHTDKLNLKDKDNAKKLKQLLAQCKLGKIVINPGPTAMEKILFSGVVHKTNRRGTDQKRVLMITEDAIYNLGAPAADYPAFKRRIDLLNVRKTIIGKSALKPKRSLFSRRVEESSEEKKKKRSEFVIQVENDSSLYLKSTDTALIVYILGIAFYRRRPKLLKERKEKMEEALKAETKGMTAALMSLTRTRREEELQALDQKMTLTLEVVDKIKSDMIQHVKKISGFKIKTQFND
jgi:hypothetical protein